MELLWEFSPTAGGDEDGFSDAYIETFTGDIERFLAREAIQNSLDAKVKESEDPVIVTFEKIELSTASFPGIIRIKENFQRCLEYWPKDNKVQKFFNEALKLINKSSTTFLKISDYNTTGLRGKDDDKEREWYNLVKAQGSSSKKDGTGGSFGIGKGAPFAASNFRIIFYSTLNEDKEYIFQGKARLVSHIQDNVVRRGIGAFGNRNQSSIRVEDEIPEFFRRSKQGTDIYISAYRGDNTWKENLITSVLENFWAAIEKGLLIVKVGDKEINTNTLEEDLIHYCGSENANSAYYYYLCYKSPSRSYKLELKYVGMCELYVLLLENAAKKISVMRKPRMLVRMFDFRAPKPFLGVFICTDEKGNNILREMEPPSHNDWEIGRIANGKKVLDEIKDWIRLCLGDITKPDESETTTILGIERYFQLPEDDEFEGNFASIENGQYSDEITKNESTIEVSQSSSAVAAKINERHKEPVINTLKEGSLGNGKKPGNKNTANKGQKRGGGLGSNDGLVIFADIECKIRCILKNYNNDVAEYIFLLKPEEDFKGNIKVINAGDDNAYPAELIECIDDSGFNYGISHSYIKDIELKDQQDKRFYVKIKAKHPYAITLG